MLLLLALVALAAPHLDGFATLAIPAHHGHVVDVGLGMAVVGNHGLAPYPLAVCLGSLEVGGAAIGHAGADHQIALVVGVERCLGAGVIQARLDEGRRRLADEVVTGVLAVLLIGEVVPVDLGAEVLGLDRKSTRLNSSH